MNCLYLFSLAVVFLFGFYWVNKKDPREIMDEIIQQNTDITVNGENSDIIIHNEEMYKKILTKGELGLAESYMDGDWSSENLSGFIKKILIHQDILEEKIKYKAPQLLYFNLKYKVNSIFNTNTISKSPVNIMKHYDIGNDLYMKMLGKTMQYTCAYYNEKNIDLDQAELNKMKLIAKKLDLKPGMSVLDIGCGFGSMAYHLVTNYNVKVTGVTLSQKQVDFAKENYTHENLNIAYKDYREVTGKYDRVYSVGIMEHIGSRNYKSYFDIKWCGSNCL